MQELIQSFIDWFTNLGPRFYDAFIAEGRYMAYFKGLLTTIEISAVAILLGVLIGVVIAVVKVLTANRKGLKWLAGICNLYITIVRGTPLILQIMIMANLIFTSRNANEVIIAGVCFGFNSGAYVAEIIRAGIESIDKGQTEAGRSLGLNNLSTMRHIIMPQAVRNILPALGNEFIVLIKESSVASVIAVSDLTKIAQYVGSRTWDVIPPYLIAAVFYLILVIGLTKLLGRFERRLAQGDRN